MRGKTTTHLLFERNRRERGRGGVSRAGNKWKGERPSTKGGWETYSLREDTSEQYWEKCLLFLPEANYDFKRGGGGGGALIQGTG